MIAGFVLLGALFAGPLSASNYQSHPPNAKMAIPANAPFDHIVTILMENQAMCSVYVGCGGSGTYESQLADQNVLVMTWGTTNHNSEPNYIALFGAINDGSTSGDGVCCYFEPGQNLVDKMEAAGITWTAFAEDAGNSGTCSFSPPRGGDHFGFIDFADMNTAARCAHFQTTASSSDPEFLASLNTPNPSNFIWLTPTDNDNGHDSGVSGGDTYLAALVPKILASTEFTTTRATLLILYDEGYSQCANTGGTGECVYASFSGPAVKKALQISPPNASHYSYAATIESAWGLSSINSNDAAAPNMLNAFAPSCATNCPLSTAFTSSATVPIMRVPITFTATTAGGKAPYAVSWSFGDGANGTGTLVTHAFTAARSFTVTETATDSSSPQQSARSSQVIVVMPSLLGNFGVCNSLPNGWSCGNIRSGAPSPTSAQIVSGVFQSRQSNPGLGGSNSYYYSTTQMGTFPWTPCTAPASGVMPPGVSSVSVNFTSLAYNPGSNPSADRYHLYIALYYWLPNGPVTAGGSTYQCLDTQVRVENIGGTLSPIGSTATYNPGDSFGWDNVTLQISPGQSGILVANVANQCLQDLQAWGIPTNTPCQLAGIEIGSEGYQFQELDANWYNVYLYTGPIPLTTSFTTTPTNPVVNTPVTFTATTFGGTAPYSITWNFGDGTSGTGVSIVHTFTGTQSYTVTENATDASSPLQFAKQSQSVTVYLTPPLSIASFQVSSYSPFVNQAVSFTASATGGTAPYNYAITFGDGSSGTGSSTSHSYSSAQSYTVTLTVTDSAQSIPVSATITVNVRALIPPTLTVLGNQTITTGAWINFTVTAKSNIGGTITLSATSLPPGASFDPNTGAFSWKPTASQTGSYVIVFTATDSNDPSAPTNQPMQIQVSQTAPGGSSGGNGGSGGTPGGCTFCWTLPKMSGTVTLLVIGGLLGLVFSLTLLTFRARANLERTKKRLG